MKRIELYQCEICNMQYNSQDKATECEASHQIPETITGYRYTKTYPKYPVAVNITFDDGKELTYKR